MTKSPTSSTLTLGSKGVSKMSRLPSRPTSPSPESSDQQDWEAGSMAEGLRERGRRSHCHPPPPAPCPVSTGNTSAHPALRDGTQGSSPEALLAEAQRVALSPRPGCR